MKYAKQIFAVASLAVMLGLFLVTNGLHRTRAVGTGRAREDRSSSRGTHGRSQERRSWRRTGAIYPRTIGTNRRRKSGDGHHVDLDRRHAGLLHESRLRDGGVGSLPRQEYGHDSRQELHCVRSVIDCLLSFRLGIDVRRRQSIFRHGRIMVRYGSRQQSGDGRCLQGSLLGDQLDGRSAVDQSSFSN